MTIEFRDASRASSARSAMNQGSGGTGPALSPIAVAFASLLAATALPPEVAAVPAAPGLFEFRQPDTGERIRVRQWGDERRHGFETETGRTIVRDPVSGFWTYAVKGWKGDLLSSGMRVALGGDREAVERGFEPRLRPESADSNPSFAISGETMPPYKQTRQEAAAFVVPPADSANIPVFLVNFSNTTTTQTAGQFNSLLFGSGTGSMSDYYKEVSYHQFDVTPGPGGIAGWFGATNTHDYYGANASGDDAWPGDLVQAAVAAADAADYPFEAYDGDGDCYVDIVAIVHQGTGEEASGISTDIWSHSWTLGSAKYYGRSHFGAYTTKRDCPAGGKIKVDDYVIQPERYGTGIQTMGVFAHEYGHALGLPDLYDVDGSSQGIGNWSLMASGSWTYVSRPGDRPAHLDPWSKSKLGWIVPTLVNGTLASESITAANTAADVYQIRGGSEYFLVENRQKSGFDAGLPGSGLLIWHIDETRATTNNTDNTRECYPGGPSCASRHYRVALVQADNLWNLEKNQNRGDAGDPYPGTSGKTAFNAASAPNSHLYSGAASNFSATGIGASAATMTATLSSAGGGSSTFSLTISKFGNGTVTSTPAGINCGADCTEKYADGTSVTLSATPASGNTFGGWGGACSGTGTCVVSMTTARSVTATFNTNDFPDFLVSAVSLSPSIPRANNSFSVTVTVRNQGKVSGDAGILTVWAHQSTAQTCGATGNQSVVVGVLAARASKKLTLTGLPAGASGSKTLRAFVDKTCATAETNDGNNQYTKTYSVRR